MEPGSTASGKGIGGAGAVEWLYAGRGGGAGFGDPDGLQCGDTKRKERAAGTRKGEAGDASSDKRGAEVQAGGVLLCGDTESGACGTDPDIAG